MSDLVLETERLRLRAWREEDIPLFARMGADPEVMRYFPRPLTAEESRAMVQKIRAGMAERGYGFWAAERKADGSFLGLIGLSLADFQSDFTPCCEIGWRLARAYWGYGYATEGARGCLGHAFDALGLESVCSFTSVHNGRSERVMRRLGMRRVGEFDHPRLEPGHLLRRHVLYRITAREFRAG